MDRNYVTVTPHIGEEGELQRLLPNPNALAAVSKGTGSKTFHQQNPPVLYWRCRLTHVSLYNGPKTAVVVVVYF